MSAADLAAIRGLLDLAFAGDFSDDDWQHALGGWHAIIEEGGRVTAHAAVVERRLRIGGLLVRAGYVEAVATAPARQGTGLGTAVMSRVGDLIQSHFDLGALSTGAWPFYERLGWERWRGPTFVRRATGELVRTPDEDEGVMILQTARSGAIDRTAPITCEERAGDSW